MNEVLLIFQWLGMFDLYTKLPSRPHLLELWLPTPDLGGEGRRPPTSLDQIILVLSENLKLFCTSTIIYFFRALTAGSHANSVASSMSWVGRPMTC